MQEFIDKMACERFGFIQLSNELQREHVELVEQLLTIPFDEAFCKVQEYMNRVRVELIARVHETKHRQARIGLNLHIASMMHQAGLRAMCKTYMATAEQYAVKATLMTSAADISVLRVSHTQSPFTGAEIAQLCKEFIRREDVLEIAAMQLKEDPLGTAYGILIDSGVDDPHQFFKDKGFVVD